MGEGVRVAERGGEEVDFPSGGLLLLKIAGIQNDLAAVVIRYLVQLLKEMNNRDSIKFKLGHNIMVGIKFSTYLNH